MLYARRNNKINRLNSSVTRDDKLIIYFTITAIKLEFSSLSVTVIDVIPAFKPLTVTTLPLIDTDAMLLSLT